MKLIDYITEKDISNIIEKYKKLISKLKIFNSENIYNDAVVNKIISSALNVIKTKNSLPIVINYITSETQFNNIAGFEAASNGAGVLHSNFESSKNPKYFELIYKKLNMSEDQIKKRWHKDMLNVLYNVFYNSKADYNIFSLNEEWHENKVVSNVDEFVTLLNKKKKKDKTKFNLKLLGNIVKPISDSKVCNPEDLKHLIRHRKFQINKDIILLNIHTSSNMDGKKASDNIIELLKLHIKKYKDKIIILGGDSNIYYGKVDKEGNGGVSDINYFYKKLKSINYELLISRNIVAKYRPYNFFQNAQSATKGGSWTNEETMIITYPKDIQVEYDSDNYIKLNKNVKIKDFHKDYSYGFLGTKYKNIDNLEKHIETINNKNFNKFLYSDHMPIYIDLLIKNKKYRFTFSNNLSINSSRGLNNNVSIFKIKDVDLLEKISKIEIANFFIEEIEGLYRNIGIEYDKKKINERKNNTSYLKYLLNLDFDKYHDIKSKKNSSSKNITPKTMKKKTVSKKKKTLFQKNWNRLNNCKTIN